MEEESNNVQDISSRKPSRSSLGNVASNVINAVGDSKYRSRRNPLNFGDNANNDSKPSVSSNAMKNLGKKANGQGSNGNLLSKLPSNMGNKLGPNPKGQVANKVLDAASNLHPALKALNTANKIMNAKKALTGGNNNSNADSDSSTPSDMLGSILNSKMGFKGGTLSVLGFIPLKVKIIALAVVAFIMFFSIAIIPIIIISFFSSLFGLE